jgi:hypothetical protein
MKKVTFLLILSMCLLTFHSFTQGTVDKAAQQEVDVIEVYYFHFTRRCATCQAVESESETALKKLYPRELESGKIVFSSINLEEETNEALAEKLEVAGQSLLVVKDGKQYNLTNDGFKYARNDPEKLESIIKETIDPIL